MFWLIDQLQSFYRNLIIFMVFFFMKGKQFKKFPLNVMSRLTSTSFIFSLMIIILFKIFRLELLKFFELARDLPVKYNTISCAVNFDYQIEMYQQFALFWALTLCSLLVDVYIMLQYKILRKLSQLYKFVLPFKILDTDDEFKNRNWHFHVSTICLCNFFKSCSS